MSGDFIKDFIYKVNTDFSNPYEATTVTTHLKRFQSDISHWTRLVFLWITKRILLPNKMIFVRIISAVL